MKRCILDIATPIVLHNFTCAARRSKSTNSQLTDLQAYRFRDLQTYRLTDLETYILKDLQTSDLETTRLADSQSCRLQT